MVAVVAGFGQGRGEGDRGEQGRRCEKLHLVRHLLSPDIPPNLTISAGLGSI